MTLNDFISDLQQLSKNYGDKDVVIECPNGLFTSPGIKFQKKDKFDYLNSSPENIEKLVIVG